MHFDQQLVEDTGLSVWVSLDEYDNDPGVFLSYLQAAVGHPLAAVFHRSGHRCILVGSGVLISEVPGTDAVPCT